MTWDLDPVANHCRHPVRSAYDMHGSIGHRTEPAATALTIASRRSPEAHWVQHYDRPVRASQELHDMISVPFG